MTVSKPLRWGLASTFVVCLAVGLMDSPDETPAAPARSPRVASVARTASSPAPGGAWPEVPRAASAAWPALSASAVAAWSAPPPVRMAASAPVRGAVTAVVAVTAPPVAPAEPVAPQAPVFPYQLIGHLDDGAGPQAMLLGPQRTVSARAGDVIDGQWRVDGIDASGLALTWIPGSQRRTVTFPSS